MPAPVYAAADYLSALQQLLPTGRAWPRDTGAVQTQVFAALMQTYARQNLRSNDLLVDAFPATAIELLPEWELTTGLPDPCAGEDPTIDLRQAHVVARLTQMNGASVPALTAFAATLGYDITITEFAPSRFGQPFGQPFYGAAWASVFQVNAPTYTIQPFEFGKSYFGDPFATFGSTVLQCELNRIKPAHTVLLFNYSTPAIAAVGIGNLSIGEDSI